MTQNNISLIKKTTTTTKKLISTVTDNRWIGSAMNWVKMAGDEEGNTAGRTEREIEQIQHHPFYRSLDAKWKEKEDKRFNVSIFFFSPSKFLNRK